MRPYYRRRKPYTGFSLWHYIVATFVLGIGSGLLLLHQGFITDFVAATIWALILVIFWPICIYMIDQAIITHQNRQNTDF